MSSRFANDNEALIAKAQSLGIDINKHQRFIETSLTIDDTTYEIDSSGEVRRKYSYNSYFPALVINRISAILPHIHLGVNYETLKIEVERLEESNAPAEQTETEQTLN